MRCMSSSFKSLALVSLLALSLLTGCGGKHETAKQKAHKQWAATRANVLYGLARLLGDVQAVRRGTVGKRIVRRAAGKATGRAMRKLLK